MADGGVIQEFLVGLGFKVDESQQNRFRQGLTQAATATTALQKQLEATAKSLTDLGKALKDSSDEPIRKYEEGQRRIGARQLDLLKITKQVGLASIEAATTFAAGILKTAQNYEQLYYIALRTNSTVAGLDAMAEAWKHVGQGGDAAAQALGAFHDALRDMPGLQGVLKDALHVDPQEIARVKKQFGGIISDEQATMEAAIQAIGKMYQSADPFVRALASQYAGLFHLSADQVESLSKTVQQRAEEAQKAAQRIARSFGDAQDPTGVKNYNENVKEGVKLQQDWNDLVADMRKLWEQSFGEAAGWLDKIVNGIDWVIKKVQELNREHPGMALAEGLAESYGAWKVASLAFGGLFKGLFKGLQTILGGAKTAAAEATAEAKVATAEAEAAGTAATKSMGIFRQLGGLGIALAAAGGASALARDTEQHSKETGQGWLRSFLTELLLPQTEERMRHAREGRTATEAPAAGAETTLPDVNVTAPAPGAAANPMYPLASHQKGGVIEHTGPAFLHSGEMVLPEGISRGLQGMIQAASQAGSSMREGASRAGEKLSDWLTGASGAVPNIAIANTEEFVTEFVRAFIRAQREAAGGGGEGGGGGATTMVPPAEPATPGGPTTAVPAAPAGPTTAGGRAGAAAGGAVGAGVAAVTGALAPPGAAQPPSAGGIQVAAGGKVDPQQLYRAAVERYKNSPLNGYVPKDGPQFGITKGTPEEWARLSVAGAMQESSLNANEPGGGLFQFEGADLARYGVKGDVNDPNAQLEAQVRQYEGSIQKGGYIRGEDPRYPPSDERHWSGAASYFGSIRRPEETLQHMADANRVAQQAQREQVVPPPTMYTGTAPTTGEAGRGAYGVPGATMNYADVTGALGKPGENLEQIPTPGGGKVTVNKGAAEAFRGFMKDLAATGYHVGQVEGFNKREKRGGTGWSEHAYGAAIDINPAANPQGGTQTNMPANIHEMAAKWGLIWGGDWKGKTYDPMHFQWGGSKPWETAVAALQKPLPEHMKPAPVQVAANPMYPQADQAAPAGPHLVSGLDHIDRAFADARLTNQSTTNNTGHTFNEGDRNVSMNPVTNITINGGEGGSPQDQSSRYSRASSRIYGDLLRNMKTNVA